MYKIEKEDSQENLRAWQDHRLEQNSIKNKINTMQKLKRPSKQANKTFISEY